MLNINFFLSVRQRGTIITISGINSEKLLETFQDVTLGDRFVNNVMLDDGWRSISFEEFFLTEVAYILGLAIEVEPSVLYKSTLTNILRKLESETWISSMEDAPSKGLNYKRLKDFYYKPLDYQQEFFEYYDSKINKYRLKGTLLGAAAGTGKTYMSLCLASLLESDRVVILSPKNAIERVWEKEIQDLYKKSPSYRLSTQSKPFTDEHIAVYHYEALTKAMDDIRALNHNAKKITVIIDESHNFSIESSGRSKALVEFIDALNTVDIIFMSGTPVKSQGVDLSVMFKAIDPAFNTLAARQYRAIYARSSDVHVLNMLQVRLGMVQFEVPKARLKLAPPKIIEFPVQIPNGDDYTLDVVKEQMARFVAERTIYYDELDVTNKARFNLLLDQAIANTEDEEVRATIVRYRRDVLIIRQAHDSNRLMDYIEMFPSMKAVEVGSIIPLLGTDAKEFKSLASTVKYPMLKIRGEALGRVLTAARIACFSDMIAGIDLKSIVEDSEKKVVIFSSYIQVCERAVTTVKGLGMQPSTVFGRHTVNLNREVNNFNTKDAYNPMVATFDSLSTAVPLVVANTVVFIDLPFRDNIRTQAISRVHRLGATTDTFILECVLDTGDKDNLSSRTIDILKWSQNQVNMITGSSSYGLESYIDYPSEVPETKSGFGQW